MISHNIRVFKYKYGDFFINTFGSGQTINEAWSNTQKNSDFFGNRNLTGISEITCIILLKWIAFDFISNLFSI